MRKAVIPFGLPNTWFLTRSRCLLLPETHTHNRPSTSHRCDHVYYTLECSCYYYVPSQGLNSTPTMSDIQTFSADFKFVECFKRFLSNVNSWKNPRSTTRFICIEQTALITITNKLITQLVLGHPQMQSA